jgi:hypothetical protein
MSSAGFKSIGPGLKEGEVDLGVRSPPPLLYPLFVLSWLLSLLFSLLFSSLFFSFVSLACLLCLSVLVFLYCLV